MVLRGGPRGTARQRTRVWIVCAASAVLLLACGDEDTVDPTGSGGSGVGGSPASGQGGTGGANAGGTAGTGGSSVGGMGGTGGSNVGGMGGGMLCPTAAINVAEGTQVAPETVLHLDGTGSQAEGGAQISNYAWTLVQPDGSLASFTPSDTDPMPTLEALVAGSYQISLTVTDSLSVPSCSPATETVDVVPGADIYIELVWDTPGDADQTDTSGADLDLHFAHANATGPDVDMNGLPDPWYDTMWDCFWFNAQPDWGPSGTLGDPALLRDDINGAGPEIIAIDDPENASYRVGVVYWSDNGFGPSTPRIRVWSAGVMVHDVTGPALSDKDLWEAVTITWPGPVVTPILDNGQPKVVPMYCNPFFMPNCP